MYKFENIEELIVWIQNQKRFEEKKSLDKIKFICELFDNPQTKFKSIHISGTNGKGSVVAYLRSILMEANLRVATFTSPYITKFNERISINNIPIEDSKLLTIANQIIDKFDILESNNFSTPSFFEFITVLAFIYFAESDIDIALIEVGIGGLLDSTNIINPLVSIITNVSFDHMNVLGNTLEEILRNKLGIVKNNSALITGIKDESLCKQIIADCKLKNSIVIFTDKYEILNSNINNMEFNYREFNNLKISLNGFHQFANATCAIDTITYLSKNNSNLFNKTNKNINLLIKDGLLKTTWPGRFEIISNNPMIVIDGAHNEDGIKKIKEYVDTLSYQSKRCIFACSDDKEKEEMLALLADSFNEIVITEYSYKRHGLAENVFNLFEHSNKILIPNLNEAIKYTINNPKDFNIFIGSLYLVSEIRPILKKAL